MTTSPTGRNGPVGTVPAGRAAADRPAPPTPLRRPRPDGGSSLDYYLVHPRPPEGGRMRPPGNEPIRPPGDGPAGPPGNKPIRPPGDGPAGPPGNKPIRPPDDGRAGLPRGGHAGLPEGIVVEEFVFGADHAVLRVDSGAWTPGGPGWWTSPVLSRSIRSDPELRGRVVGVLRHEAGAVYRQLGGGPLPDEDTLRGHLLAGDPRPTSAPLLLGLDQVTPGFHDTRVYRVLFAREPGADDLAHLATAWRMTLTDPATRDATTTATAGPGGVLGTAHRRVGADAFRWELRRIGTVGAYCLDLTVDLATGRDDGVAPMLRELTTALRLRGLIPVTVERFS